MKGSSLQAVNAALPAVQPYLMHSELRKEAYGAKAKGLSEQYANYVPPEAVPDRYDLPGGGHTWRLSRNVRQTSLRASFERAVQVQKSGDSTYASQTVNHMSRQQRHGSHGHVADLDSGSAGSGDVRVSETGARMQSGSGEDGRKDGGHHGEAHGGGENAAMARTCPSLQKVRWSSVAHKDALIRALLSSPVNGRLSTKLTA